MSPGLFKKNIPCRTAYFVLSNSKHAPDQSNVLRNSHRAVSAVATPALSRIGASIETYTFGAGLPETWFIEITVFVLITNLAQRINIS
ncbi:hypothetical protein EJN92_04440 [Undibacterium parvum]|uniref:Uncharacterized protein n=1 Tax=Undibacterium parvum TaxID=401471 RepID=A0A3Q9BPW7_9BURK|nr:hypothetical protein EJN92_04440 [Undibacterium parvum]